MEIHGLNKTTLLDYPGRVASTIFTGACNFRCPFCQNGDLVLSPKSQPTISEDEIFEHLKKRKGILTGVCISGGEPTLQKDLKDFIIKIKELGYLVKLDTNGYRPEVLKDLYDSKLIDYVAMDIKSGISGYSEASGVDIDITKIKESIALIMDSKVEYEFRTTVVKELHKEKDFEEIGEMIRGAEQYFLQAYVDSDCVIKPGLSSYNLENMEKIVEKFNNIVKKVKIRGL